MKLSPLFLLALTLSTPLLGQAQSTYNWLGSSGSNWSSTSNWTTTSGTGTTVPGAGDTGVIGSVSSGTNIVVYDAAASASLGTLSLTETTAGATNEVSLQRSLALAGNLTLSASAGTSLLYFDTYTANASALTLSIGGGTGTLTVGTGGVFQFSSSLSSSATTATSASSPTISGNVAVTGGTLNVERGTYQYVAYPDTITGNLSISAGTIALGSPSLTTTGSFGSIDSRLVVNGNLVATGGSITTPLAKGYTTLYLNGATNDLSGLTSFNTNININLSGATSAAQSLSLGSNSVGAVTFRNSVSSSTAVKTISSTGGTIGAITFDGHAGAASITMLLGSNLTLATNAAMPTNSAYGAGGYTQTYTIDTANYVLDLSAGTNGAALAPINQYTTSTMVNWVMQGSGTIKAGSFNISETKASSVLGSVTLQATGGSGTVNNLGNYGNSSVSATTSGTPGGTIAATTTFLYSGAATSASMASLVSNRTIGALAVQNGFLNIAQASLVTGGGVTLSSGGLSLNGTGAAGTLTLSSGQNFTMTGGTLVFDIGTAQDQVLSLGSGTFSISGGTLSLTLGTGFDYNNSYSLLSGFTSGSVSNLAFTGYDTVDYTASLSASGVLTFAAVPEPGTDAFLLAGGLVLFVAVRRRQTCGV